MGNGTCCLLPLDHTQPHNTEGREIGRFQPELMVGYVVSARLEAICGRKVHIDGDFTPERVVREVNLQVPDVKACIAPPAALGVVKFLGRPRTSTPWEEAWNLARPFPVDRAQLEQLYRDQGSTLPPNLRETAPPDPMTLESVREIVRAMQALPQPVAMTSWDADPRNFGHVSRTTFDINALRSRFDFGTPVPAQGIPPRDLTHFRVVERTTLEEPLPPYEWEGGDVSLYDESHDHQNDEPIHTWEVASKRKGAGGRYAVYEVVLYGDGCASCDCPGWVFKRKDKPRGCKHIDGLHSEIQATHRRHLHGGPPVEERTPEENPSQPVSRYGRTLDIS